MKWASRTREELGPIYSSRLESHLYLLPPLALSPLEKPFKMSNTIALYVYARC